MVTLRTRRPFWWGGGGRGLTGDLLWSFHLPREKIQACRQPAAHTGSQLRRARAASLRTLSLSSFGLQTATLTHRSGVLMMLQV